MGNMSYCRFQNTLDDLKDCFYNMDDEELSPAEAKAKYNLILVCTGIYHGYTKDEEPVYDSEGNYQG